MRVVEWQRDSTRTHKYLDVELEARRPVKDACYTSQIVCSCYLPFSVQLQHASSAHQASWRWLSPLTDVSSAEAR